MILAAQALLWLNRLLWYFLWIFPHYFSAEVALTDRTGCDSDQGSVGLSSRSGLEHLSQDKPRKAPKTRAAAATCLTKAEHLLAQQGQALDGLHSGVTAQSSK